MDHKGQLITSLILNSNHIIFNQNTPTRLPFNPNQQHTSPDITTTDTTISTNLTWQTLIALNFDHLPILVTFKNKYKISTTKPFRTLTNYKKANRPQFTKYIEHTLKNTPLHEDPHTTNHLITNAILTSDQINIPKGIIKPTHTPFPESITTLISKRNHTRTFNKKDPSLPTLNQHITHLIQQHKKQKWEEHLKTDWDHKKKSHILWSIVKALNPKKPTTPTNTTITHNNKTAHTDTQKTNTLNKYFKSTTKHSPNPTHRITKSPIHSHLPQ